MVAPVEKRRKLHTKRIDVGGRKHQVDIDSSFGGASGTGSHGLFISLEKAKWKIQGRLGDY